MWTREELQDMAAYDSLIDEMPWGPAEEAAAEAIREQLMPEIMRRLEVEVSSSVPYRTEYKKETRPGKGRRKSKGNVAAQKARRYARQKLKKQLLEGL